MHRKDKVPGFNDGIFHTENNWFGKNKRTLHPEYPETLPINKETCSINGCYTKPIHDGATCLKHSEKPKPKKHNEEEYFSVA